MVNINVVRRSHRNGMRSMKWPENQRNWKGDRNALIYHDRRWLKRQTKTQKQRRNAIIFRQRRKGRHKHRERDRERERAQNERRKNRSEKCKRKRTIEKQQTRIAITMIWSYETRTKIVHIFSVYKSLYSFSDLDLLRSVSNRRRPICKWEWDEKRFNSMRQNMS